MTRKEIIKRLEGMKKFLEIRIRELSRDDRICDAERAEEIMEHYETIEEVIKALKEMQ